MPQKANRRDNRDLLSAVDGVGAERAASVDVIPHSDYQNRPLEWIIEKLGVGRPTMYWSENEEYVGHRWDGDTDPFVAASKAIAAGSDVGIESATGTGKTFWLACIVLWFLACFDRAMVVTVAPKEAQLLLHVWKEIGRMWPSFQGMFPHAQLSRGKIRMLPAVEHRELWTAVAFVCGVGADEETATKAQGFHAEHMLIITEETPGIDGAIMRALDNTRTDDHNLHLAVGNPDNQHDELHRFCVKPNVEYVRISALDHPNLVTGRRVVPGAVSRKREQERKHEYGPESRLYRSRIRGISPAEAADALIRRAWCESAARLYDEPRFREGPEALGVDVSASLKGDKAAIAHFLGACCLEVRSFQHPNPVLLAVEVAAEMGNDIDPRRVGVDSVGVGAGTVNKLKELGLWVRAISAGSKPVSTIDREARALTEIAVVEVERFYNLRSQMWWYARRDLQKGYVPLPQDEELWEDLTTPTWWTRNGKIYVESKEDIKKRLGRSPDKGDAFVMGNWVRARADFQLVDPEEEYKGAFHPDTLAAERDFVYRVREHEPSAPVDPLMVEM